MRSDSVLVFAYGTLKRGHCRAAILADQRFRGEVRTQPLYRLYSVHGHYPALIDTTRDGVLNPGVEVVGEVYEITEDILGQLDDIEGVAAGLFERRQVELQEFEGDIEAYFWRGKLDGLTDIGCRW